MEKEKITIKDLAVLWKKDKRQYVKQSTYSAYALIVENQIIPTFGNLYALTEADVQSFVIDRLNSGLSQKYVKDILIVLKMIVRFGEKARLSPTLRVGHQISDRSRKARLRSPDSRKPPQNSGLHQPELHIPQSRHIRLPYDRATHRGGMRLEMVRSRH